MWVSGFPGSLVFGWFFLKARGRVSEGGERVQSGLPQEYKVGKTQFAPSET